MQAVKGVVFGASSAKTESTTKVPELTGFWNSIYNLGESSRFPSHFHLVRHYINLAYEKTTSRAGLWDVVKAIYTVFKKIFFMPQRYETKPRSDCRLVDLSQPFHPKCPMMHYDFSYVIKCLHATAIYDNKMIRQVLRSNRQDDSSNICVTSNYEGIGKISKSGRTPFTARNEDYNEYKQFLRPLLSTKSLIGKHTLANQMKSLSAKVVDNMKAAEGGVVKDISELTFSLPSEVIQCVLFGKVVSGLKDNMWKMILLINRIFSHTGKQSHVDEIINSKAFVELDDLVKQICTKPYEYPGLLSEMLEETNEDGDPKFSKDDIFSTLIFFLTAGEDTLSSAITSTFYELGRHPEVQKKLIDVFEPYHKEHDAIDLKVLDSIPYLNWVVKEILRLYPSLPVLNRRTNPDRAGKNSPVLLESGEGQRFSLKDDRMMLIYLREANRDSAYWEEPESFIPERWSKELMSKYRTANGNFLSFSIGPNRCLGEALARLELKALIYYTLKEIQFETVNETFFDVRVTLMPLNPVSIKVLPRD